MAQQKIYLGASANDLTGTKLRPAGVVINENFTELYTQKAPLASPSFSGSVGIGTSTPSTALDIASDSAIDVYTRIRNSAGALFDIGVSASGTNYLYGRSNAPMVIGTNNADRMAILSTGQVGIGTNSPGAKLHVRGGDLQLERNVGVDGAVFFGAGGTEYIYGSTTDHTITTGTNGVARLLINGSGNILFGGDGTQNLGGPSNRGSVAYFTTGTINTSDAREKTPVRPFSAAEIAAARALVAEIGVYQWLDMVEQKGPDIARLHIGMTVQRAIEIMEAHGLDPWRYGFVCRDAITRKVKVTQTVSRQKTEPDPETDLVVEIIDGAPRQVRVARSAKPVFEMKPVIGEDGEIVMQTVVEEAESGFPIKRVGPLLYPVPVMIDVPEDVWVDEPAGYRLGFRYDQLISFILAGLLPRIEALEG